MSAPSPEEADGARLTDRHVADGEARIRHIDVDGVRLRTSVRGEGRPLLILTGIGAPLELSAPFERAITPYGVQTITLDAPGTGESSPYRVPRRMPGLARTVVAALDALGHDRVDVLGLSFGGILAQQLAHTAPGKVRRLVLVATAPGVAGLGGIPGSPTVLGIMATPRRYTSPDYHRRVAGTIYGGEARHDPDAHLRAPGTDNTAARVAHAPSSRGYAAQLYALTGWSGMPWLWRLRVPTLVLAGDDDPIIPLANGRILARTIPGARLEVVAGGGHLFMLERPEETAALVAEFLDEYPA